MWEIPVLFLIYFLLTYFFPTRTEDKTTELVGGIQSNKISGAKERKAEPKQNKTVSPEVKKRRGKVPTLEYEVLQEHRVEMVNKLVPAKVLPFLKQNKVIDQDDVERIEKKCNDLRRKGAETMLGIIYNSGQWAFKQLIKALTQAEYIELAAQLTRDLEKKKTDPHVSKTVQLRGSLSEVESEVLRDNYERLVNELDSSILKNSLFQNKLIDEDAMDMISKKEEESRKEGAEEIVTIIFKSGANAFSVLLKSLEDAGYDELSSKLYSDFKHKKNLVAFPDYPVVPELMLDEGNDAVSNWQERLTTWKTDGAGILVCVAMNNWFKDHEFKSEEELKMVVKYWLLKLKEVVNKGCLEIDAINILLDVTEKLQGLDRKKSLCYIYEMFGSMAPMEDFEPGFIISKRAQKQRLHEQQRQVFEKLKHNLEGIIGGNQNFHLLPIDTESCELAGKFHSVVNDVRELWHKLH